MKNMERRTILSALAGLPAAGMLGGLAPVKNGIIPVESEMKEAALEKAPKYRGVVYDVGLNFAAVHDMGLNAADGLGVPPPDPAQVDYEMHAIKNVLHANTVRIEGERIDRLVMASRLAHKHGLTIFFNPWKMNANAAELRPFYAEAAKEAEKLRKEGVDIVFVAGCEYPFFQKGLVPGDTVVERIGALFAGTTPEKAKERMDPLWAELNEILKSFVDVIRPEFKGSVTYAATTFEKIDWSMFDIVGIDHYRGAESAEEYVDKLNGYKGHDKPIVCMEVGCCAYVGGAKAGGGGFLVFEGVNPDGSGRFKDGVVPTRSEREQADYIETQVKLLANNGAAGVFIFAFAAPFYTHGEGAKDLDLVSYALVKTYPEDDARSKAMPPWAPKESFHRLAGLFAQMDQLSA